METFYVQSCEKVLVSDVKNCPSLLFILCLAAHNADSVVLNLRRVMVWGWESSEMEGV